MADVNGVWSAGLTGLSGDSLPDLFQFGTLVNFLASPGHWSAEHAKEFVNMLRYFFLDFFQDEVRALQFFPLELTLLRKKF